MQRGRESEEQARQQRDGGGEGEHAQVYARLGEARDVRRGERDDEAQRDHGEQKAEQAADRREQ